MFRSTLTTTVALFCSVMLAGSAAAQRGGGNSHGGGSHGGFSSGGYRSQGSSYRPSTPSYRPSTPSYRPSTPSYRPQTTGYRNTASYRPSQGYAPARPTYRPQNGYSARPSYRPSTASMRPVPTSRRPLATQRPGRGYLASNRPTPTQRRPIPTSRRPVNGQLGANSLASFKKFQGGMKQTAKTGNGLSLADSTVGVLAGLPNSGLVNPQAAHAIADGLAGNLLSNPERRQLVNALAYNKNLTPAQRRAIAALLQEDKANKALNALANMGGGQSGNCGGSSDNGGCPDNGGGCSGNGDGGSGSTDGGSVVSSGGAGDGGNGSDGQVVTSNYSPAPDGGDGQPTDGSQMASANYGVQITRLSDGTAHDQGLMVGDTILSYNGTPTPSIEALCSAVQQSSGQVDVVFLNAQNGQTESMVLYPQDGRIGVDGQTVQVP